MNVLASTMNQSSDIGAELVEKARSFVPRIRALARTMEQNRRLDDDLLDDMEAAGLFSVALPKIWGGHGLGPRELAAVLEVIGSADCSTAWIAIFYNYHNYWLSKFPREAQEEIYKNGPAVRCAATFAPPGKAERVEGGYRVTGRWPYASGAWHATHILLTCIVEGDFCFFIVPASELELFDDWHMASMSATGSISVSIKDYFVPDGWWSPISRIMSADQHGGTFHEEPTLRYHSGVFSSCNGSIWLGALLNAVEVFRERVHTSRPQGTLRIDHPAARSRWAEVHESAQMLRLLRDGALNEAIARAESGLHTPEDDARAGLHDLALIHGAKDTLRKIIDGCGSSVYKVDDPLRRAAGDVAMLSTHALGPDYDVHIDRHASNLLGYAGVPVGQISGVT